MTYRKKLIEVSLPLEAINKESAREKSIRHGHISTLHLYWARRPLASCRAVLFGMLVDDPGSVPEEFPTEEEQAIERDRLHRLLEKLVIWENSNDDSILHRARWEIARSIGRSKGIEPPAELNLNEHLGVHDNKEKRNALIDWLHEHGPLIHDPFCGGGAIPLEAQRLGLRTMGTDLNPLAVMITKAGVEIPAKFADMPPINPEAEKSGRTNWRGAEGLAEDVRYYGECMRETALERIGHNYPNVTITREMVDERPDLKKYLGRELAPIAWIWARNIPSPNPSYSSIRIPLVKSFQIASKSGKQHWIRPILEGNAFRFKVEKGVIPEDGVKSTISRTSATCLASKSSIPLSQVRQLAQAGKMSSMVICMILDGDGERVYISPIESMDEILKEDFSESIPNQKMQGKCTVSVPLYGMPYFSDLFTQRQLMYLSTLIDSIDELEPLIQSHVGEREINSEYLVAIITYLCLGISKMTDNHSSLVTWNYSRDQTRTVFGRQALPMTWDFAEVNPFSGAAGDYSVTIKKMAETLTRLPAIGSPEITQLDATTIFHDSEDVVFLTDPPYYDNIEYADISDYFYVWLRLGLHNKYPRLMSTLLTPKKDEIIASNFHQSTKKMAYEHFMSGMTKVISRMQKLHTVENPVCFYYAFKQNENSLDGKSSPGWVTFLQATIDSGFRIVGTIPSRTERANKLLGANANQLSTSIVLVCRRRSEDDSDIRRTDFLRELRDVLHPAVKNLQEGGISPIDLAQAAIGPGIGIFSKYSAVLEADGSRLSVNRALEIINQELSVILGETDDEIDPESRVCLRWFGSFGEEARVYGELDSVLKSVNASPDKIGKSGCMIFSEGKVRIAEIDSYPEFFHPKDIINAPAWAHVHRLIRLLDMKGESEAAAYMRHMPSHQRDSVRSLTYRLYQICDEKKMMQHAKNYNTLAVSWGQVADRSQMPVTSTQVTLGEF